VEWGQQVGATYTVTVLPTVPINSTGTTSRQLTILYNTEYTFIVEAISPHTTCTCWANPTASKTLKYG
jgi:hypothetical protein